MLCTNKKYIETFNLFDLIEDKKINLYYFFTESIKEILSKFSNSISDTRKFLKVFADDFFIKISNENNQIFKDETYNISLYVPIELFDKKTNSIKKFNLFICNLPFLFENHCFWINGIPKILHQQIVFDPSLFLESTNSETVQASFYDEKQEIYLQITLDENDNLHFSNHFNKFNHTINIFIDKPFQISEKTRQLLNNKFNIEIPHKVLFLTKTDVLKIKDYIRNVKKHKSLIPDLDDLENKSLKYLNEYLTKIICYNLELITNSLKKNINDVKVNNLFNVLDKIRQNNISFDIDELFSNSDVSLPIEQINPLSELSQQRKVLNLKKQEGNENISLDIRNIHYSSFGRLCPIDTPEGGSAGLITSLTTVALINKFGWLQTPLVFNKNNKEIISGNIKFYNVKNEELKVIKFANNQNILFSLNFKSNIKIAKEFSETTLTNVKSSFLSYLQVFSVACSNIPFLEHNDGNRILMGANMQKQAVPLLFPENTIVSSGIEEIIATSTNVIKSLSNGIIIYCDSSKIIIKTQTNKKLIYFLDKIKPTFNETVINNSSALWIGEKVFFGQVLVNGFSIKNSELSLGTNLTVAYMNWDGFNFEDAIIINERLLKNDKLTSLHCKTILIELTEFEEIHHFNKTFASYFSKNKLNCFGITTKNRQISKGDIILVKKSINDVDQQDKLIFVESDFDGYISNIELKIPFVDSKVDEKIEYHNKVLKIDVLQQRKICVGDKLSGRFGNKGVISRIVSEIDMPFLLDGTSVDILLNPLGIPSRMNVGQIFETILGFVGTNLKTRYRLLSFDECFGKHSSKILINQKLKENKFFQRKSYSLLSNNFDKNYVVDGRSGELMDNPVLVGRTYILKLFHLAQDKLTSRTVGPNSLLTNQPLKGKKLKGGQRLGEMEVWALEAYGASYSLHEMLTFKSDDIFLNNKLVKVLEKDFIFNQLNYSKSLFILDLDLKSLGFDLSLNVDDFNNNSQNPFDVLNEFKRRDILVAAKKLLRRVYSKYES